MRYSNTIPHRLRFATAAFLVDLGQTLIYCDLSPTQSTHNIFNLPNAFLHKYVYIFYKFPLVSAVSIGKWPHIFSCVVSLTENTAHNLCASADPKRRYVSAPAADIFDTQSQRWSNERLVPGQREKQYVRDVGLGGYTVYYKIRKLSRTTTQSVCVCCFQCNCFINK